MRLSVQLTGGGDTTEVLGVSPDENWLVVSRDLDAGAGLYVMPAAGGPLRVVIHAPKVHAELAYVTDDSTALYYAANDLDPASNAIYRWDLADGQKTLVFDEPGRWRIVDHLGDRWLMEKELGTTQVEVYEYELTAKKLVPLLGQGEPKPYDVRFGAKPGQVIVRTGGLGELQQLYILEGGKLAPFGKRSPHAVTGLAIDEARARIYVTENVDGYARLHVLDARTQRPIELPKLPEADNVTLGGLSRNGRFVQITLDGARLAPTTVVWDWTAKKLVTWRVPAAPEIDVSAFAPVAVESYPARDGTKMAMVVRRPATCEQPCPVIVSLHGGPAAQARPGFDAYAQMFIDAGFVVVEPNVREAISDLDDVSRYLRTAWAKDGKAPKLGLIGDRDGGTAALLAMSQLAGAYDAAVAEDPAPADLARLKAPLLLVQGVNDPRMPVGDAVQIHDELERRGVAAELILFPDEGHGTAKRSNIVLQVGHAIAFFERHLR
jgi:dipeptidyl aminopeptidase/acylaminoacyl peptidase